MWCPNCGTKLKDNARFCPECGANVAEANVGESVSYEQESGMNYDDYQGEQNYQGYADLEVEDRELPKKSKMPLIIILVILIVGITLGVGAYFLFNRDSKEDEKVSGKQVEETVGEPEGAKKEERSEEEATEAEEETEAMPDVDPATLTGRMTASPTSLSSYGKLDVYKASATSVVAQEGHDNSANMVLDGRDESSWQEGVDGTGIGEGLTFEFDKEVKVKYLSLKLGNWRSSDYYWQNNRPKTLQISTDTGSVTTLTFPDEQVEYWIEFPTECPASEIQITIQDVYRGSSSVWNDTCIAGIELYGVTN